jgi:hypothetical protein
VLNASLLTPNHSLRFHLAWTGIAAGHDLLWKEKWDYAHDKQWGKSW